MLDDFKETTWEVIQAVVPLTAVAFFILLLIESNTELLVNFLGGSFLVIIGMILFLFGVKLGMLPMGNAVGSELPKHNSVILILAVAFILSFIVTLAEPNVRVLSTMMDSLNDSGIPRSLFILAIASSVGISILISMLRIIYGVPIKYLLTVSYLFIVAISFLTKPEYLAIAFDSGGVATGLLTIPVLMALGTSIVSVLSEKSELSEGFGLIGLAAVGPIITVMLMGVL